MAQFVRRIHTEENQKKIREAYSQQNLETRTSVLNLGETIWKAREDYKGAHYDHFYNFFQSIRGQRTVIQDPTFGLRAAGAALLANESYYIGKPVNWDPEKMELV